MKTHERVIRSHFLWLALLAVILVLFPFDWLSEVWPAFGQIFDRIFVSTREHAIGHATLFLLAGMLVLCSMPRLRWHPFLYMLIMVLGSLGEEFFQALSRRQTPNVGDGRDLGFDALGFVLAYLLIWGWWYLRKVRRGERKKHFDEQPLQNENVRPYSSHSPRRWFWVALLCLGGILLAGCITCCSVASWGAYSIFSGPGAQFQRVEEYYQAVEKQDYKTAYNKSTCSADVYFYRNGRLSFISLSEYTSLAHSLDETQGKVSNFAIPIKNRAESFNSNFTVLVTRGIKHYKVDVKVLGGDTGVCILQADGI